jgi:hypothetical protein
MQTRLTAVLEAILAATPEPPEGAAEPSDILERLEAILGVRTPLLDEMAGLIGTGALPKALLPLVRELDRRTAAWLAAAQQAQAIVGAQISAIHSAT